MNMNSVGWFEIYVKDMPRAKSFYEAVFDRKLEKLGGADASGISEMWAFAGNPENAGATGALVKMENGPAGVGGTIIYFVCDDCSREAARAVKNGGTIMKDKFSIGPYGHIALVHDTEGNLIGLHSMK
jgi:uncharacterized protein